MEAMEFMDPRRRKRHDIMLLTGYGLIAIAILLLTTILVFVAYGFGVKNGVVIQNGLVFLSSNPNPAQIFIDGKRYKNDTNTRLVLPAGTYALALQRSGYRDWQRTVTVAGGDVQSLAYPMLFPSSLTTSTRHEYTGAPAVVTQSPDRRWLLVSQPGSIATFDEYDLSDFAKAPAAVTIPEGILSPSTGAQSLSVIDWSDDNAHLLLKHAFDSKAEYVMLDRQVPAQSFNLTQSLSAPLSGIEIQLSNKQYDHYFVYNFTTRTLARASLALPRAQTYLRNVLAFDTYGNDTVLYASPDALNKAKVTINIFDGSTTFTIRHAPGKTTYLLDITTYGGDTYVATAAASEGIAYVYKNPVQQITNQRLGVAIPVDVLSIKNPNYVAFSATAQYVLFENKTRVAIYDAENDQGYTYVLHDTLDTPQTHVAWMDGARLDYTSHGQVVIVDYDGTNRQVLVPANPAYDTYFDRDYKFLYALEPPASDSAHELLTSTSLRTPADQ